MRSVACHIVSNTVFHEQIKYREIDCHFVRKCSQEKSLLIFVSSSNQLADMFQKSLKGFHINHICNKLSTYDIYAPTFEDKF